MSREFLLGLGLGLIIGWIIEWIIDWTYWRRRYQKFEEHISATKDDLRKIKGIGPVIEERLNHAGILTFKQLSRLTAENLEEIIGNAERLADETDILKQAKKLAKKKKKGRAS